MKTKYILPVLILLISLQQLSAHPHMMLTSRCTVHMEKDLIKGITLEWEFDKFFSADTRFYYDQDKNGIYDDAETAEVFQYAFSNLKKYNYFTFFRVGDKRFTPNNVTDFTVWNIDDETLAYSFYIPLDNFNGNELNIAVYDYSFFCHVSYDEENPVRLDLTDCTEKPVFSLEENKDYPVYYDPFAPMSDLSIHEKWRPGLKTFYPTEIQIEY
ncbi:MAG: hypothetical protein B6241_15360 [Spirochaetaceae bacterium 4572_59]|nr:MAG: hypothetical protein B6241_15360 [Spirochaetaceae bacterium 4572_59]